jgi:hypothetical protein
MWDLRHEASKQAKLRTNQRYGPHVVVDPVEGWRLIPRGGTIRTLAAPGTYTVKLRVGEQELSEELSVLKDPNSAGTDADIRAQVEMSLELRDNVNTVVEMIEQIEWSRKQIYDLIALLEGDESAEEIVGAGKELDEKLIALEENLFQMKRTPRADSYRWKTRLYGKMLMLGGELESVWGAVGHDFAPTTQQVEVHELFKERMATYQSQLAELVSVDIPQFNRRLEEGSFPTIFVKSPEAPVQ